MGGFVRWTAFALATAAIAVAGSLLLLVLSRNYGAMQSGTFVFTVLAVFCVSVTLAAIGYASKLEDAAQAAAEREAAAEEERRAGFGTNPDPQAEP